MMHQNMFDYINNLIKQSVFDLYKIKIDNFTVEYPQNSDYGDFATNVCLILRPQLNKNPMDIAKEICNQINDTIKDDIFDNIDFVKPGFINFTLSKNYLKTFLTQHITSYPFNVDKKNILIEFSQPNPNKPMHIGHARNNFLGSSMSNILGYLGHNIIRANYYNDWGSPVCKTMLMHDLYQNEVSKDIHQKSDHYIGDLYILYSQKEQENPQIKEKVTKMFQDLENGDQYTTDLWNKVLNLVYKGWETTYKDQKVDFDVIFKQSDYKDSGKKVVDMALQNGVAYKDESGAIIADLQKYDLPNKVLLRSDGTSLYITQDLEMAMDSINKFNLDQKIYVVDVRQSDYFKQLFKVLEVIGFKDFNKLHHLAYGFVSLPQGKMSSRSGVVVNADDAFEEVKNIESKEIESSIKDIKNKEETIKKVSMAAFKYGMLKIDPKKDITFNYDQITKFEGNTGPYLLYTYARMNSILQKSGIDINEFFNLKSDDLQINGLKINDLKFDKLQFEQKEYEILRHLSKFNNIVLNSADQYSPNVLANYLYDLCQKFNSYYGLVRILDSINQDKNNIYKLMLVSNTSLVLKKGLELLGIDVVEKM